MALASSGSSVSEISDPKLCSSCAISFTVTAKVSIDCRYTHIFKGRVTFSRACVRHPSIPSEG